MKMLSVLAIFGLLSGCAGKDAKLTGMDKVQQNREAIASTGEKLRSAQTQLNEFQKTVEELRKSFENSKAMATSREAAQRLDSLSSRVEQARIDIQDLVTENARNAQDLSDRLSKAAQENRKVISD